MVVGWDLVKELKLVPRSVPSITVEFANEEKEEVDKTITLKERFGDYYQAMDFYVANIGRELILGIPFLNSIHITDLRWQKQELSFVNLLTSKTHTWFGPKWGRQTVTAEAEKMKKDIKKILVLKRAEFQRYAGSQ